MAKKDSGNEEVASDVEPLSVIITVNKFTNIIPSDYRESGDASHNNLTHDSSQPGNKYLAAKESDVGNEISSIFNDVDVAHLSNAFCAEHSKEALQTDAQKFQANEKISKVLQDSGSFDSINDAQVLKHRLRTLEIEKLALMVDHNNLIREFNKSVESHLHEIGKLSEINKAYEHEIQELRDLTCFLDDDRKKFRKIAKEWQKFGRHTVHVLKNEVVSYQDKLAASECKEKGLIMENMELRELCVHLDKERTNGTNKKEASTKFTGCSQCLEPPKNACKMQSSSKSKMLGDICEQNVRGLPSLKHPTKREDMLLNIKSAQTELHNIQMIRSSENRSEKKKVKFDFPDDSDTSTTSDIDNLEFPPRIAEFEKISKLGKVFPELNISSEGAPAHSDRVHPRTNILKKFDEENLSSDHLFFPSSPKKPTLNTKGSYDLDHKDTIEEEKNELTDSDISTTSTPTSPPTFHDATRTCERKGSEDSTFESGFNQDPFDNVSQSKYI